MLKTISALKTRKNLGEVLEEVFYKREHFIIKRGDKPMAAIISIPEYEAFRQQREKDFNLSEAVAEKDKKTVSPARAKQNAQQVKDVLKTGEMGDYTQGSDVY